MGKRDSFSTVEKGGDTYTLYQYTNQFCNAHVSLNEKCDFFVIFKNNKVIETGVKKRSRTNATNAIYLSVSAIVVHNTRIKIVRSRSL
jgi:hypothetical protein